MTGNWSIGDHPCVTFTGRRAPYSDPLYGKPKTMEIYRFQGEEAVIEIGFDEVANGVFIAYAAPEDLSFCEPRYTWEGGKLAQSK